MRTFVTVVVPTALDQPPVQQMVLFCQTEPYCKAAAAKNGNAWRHTGEINKGEGIRGELGNNEGVLQLFLQPFTQCRSASETTTVHFIKTLNNFYITAATSALGNGMRELCSILGRKSSRSRQASLPQNSTCHQHNITSCLVPAFTAKLGTCRYTVAPLLQINSPKSIISPYLKYFK